MTNPTRCGHCGAELTPDRNPASITTGDETVGYCHVGGFTCYTRAVLSLPLRSRVLRAYFGDDFMEGD